MTLTLPPALLQQRHCRFRRMRQRKQSKNKSTNIHNGSLTAESWSEKEGKRRLFPETSFAGGPLPQTAIPLFSHTLNAPLFRGGSKCERIVRHNDGFRRTSGPHCRVRRPYNRQVGQRNQTSADEKLFHQKLNLKRTLEVKIESCGIIS